MSNPKIIKSARFNVPKQGSTPSWIKAKASVKINAVIGGHQATFDLNGCEIRENRDGNKVWLKMPHRRYEQDGTWKDFYYAYMSAIGESKDLRNQFEKELNELYQQWAAETSGTRSDRSGKQSNPPSQKPENNSSNDYQDDDIPF